jgi:hypothetical protein
MGGKLMSRPTDPQSQFRVRVHNTKGYAYASTQVPYIDPDSKNKKYRYIHWGTVDEGLRFIPGSSFF